MNKFKFSFLLFIAFAYNMASQSSSKKTVLNSEIHILFIGNSLTYSNNLPQLVIKAGRKKGVRIKTKMIAHSNYAIMDHWNDGEVQKEIASKKYNFVVLQQGPSSQPLGREILIEYGKKYKDLCKKNNTKLSYFMVWPSLKYYHTFDGVIKNHKDASRFNDAILCPVGTAWKKHFDTTQNFDYYGSDGFHPSLKGSKVAANVIVEHLFLKKK